jgi:hypothetical protein
MYCPKCSQQQSSEEMRFCSRCGFPLSGVGLLLRNEGMLPVPGPERNTGRRRQMIKESVLFTLGAWVVMLVAMVFWESGGMLEIVGKGASVIFFLLGLIGLLRFVFTFLFVKGDIKPTEPALSASTLRASLPSPQDVPLSDYPLRTNTREMVPRGSVTENTTRWLDEK